MATRAPDRKAQIVSAAAELFALKGYSAVGIDDIGAVVGVSGPAIYRHFQGKDALLAEVVLSSMRHIEAALAGAGAGRDGADPDAVIQLGVAAVLDHAAGLTTAMREARRIAGSETFALAQPIQHRIDAHWRWVVDRMNPDLDATSIAIRRAAMLGVAVGVALNVVEVPRPRLDALCHESLRAIISAPQAPSDPAAKRAAAWQPPPSRGDGIVRAAVMLFAAHGFAAVSMADIAAAARMSIPTVYRRHRGKHDLLVAAFDLAARRLAASTDGALTGAPSARAAMRRLVRSYVSLVIDDIGLIAVSELEADSLPDDDRFRLTGARQAIHEQWSDVLCEAVPGLRRAEAAVRVAIVFPLVNLAVSLPPAPPDQTADIAAVALSHLTRPASESPE